MSNLAISSQQQAQSINIMIVDDSLVIRRYIQKILQDIPNFNIVALSSNGFSAVATLKILEVKPDIIILDIEMPVMDGITALPKILETDPSVQIIIASTLTQRNAEISLKALQLGASDYIPKPTSLQGEDLKTNQFANELIFKIKAFAKQKKSLSIEANNASNKEISHKNNQLSLKDFPPYPSDIKPKYLMIGASTGGPKALLTFIKKFRAFNKIIPILITQHLPPIFTKNLAKQIESTTGARTVEADEGQKIEQGTIYIAPGNFHMCFNAKGVDHFIKLTQSEKVHFCRPSVDVMLDSAIDVLGSTNFLTLILTGMGRDGAKATIQIIKDKSVVIAQDKASSMVWGMPGAVYAQKTCQDVRPLEELAEFVHTIINNDIGTHTRNLTRILAHATQ